MFMQLKSLSGKRFYPADKQVFSDHVEEKGHVEVVSQGLVLMNRMSAIMRATQ